MKYINVLYFATIIIAFVVNFIISNVFYKDRVKHINVLCVLETGGIILGAKLLDILINYDTYIYYFNNGIYINIFLNGYMYVGGILLTVCLYFLYAKIFKEDFVYICELMLPSLLLIYSILKIGCFINGCCSGIIISNNFKLPIQFIESILYFIIFLYVTLTRKNKIMKVCIIFGLTRFLVEFLREKNYYSFMSFPQIISLLFFIIGIIFFINNVIKRREFR